MLAHEWPEYSAPYFLQKTWYYTGRCIIKAYYMLIFRHDEQIETEKTTPFKLSELFHAASTIQLARLNLVIM